MESALVKYPMNEHTCLKCNVILTEENWQPSRKHNYSYICRACDNQRNKLKHTKLKLEIIEAYGGKCICCNCQIVEFLTLDHINNDGAEHRQKIREEGDNNFYRWIKKNNFPKDNFQLLCLNCNFAKFVYGLCPHNKSNIIEENKIFNKVKYSNCNNQKCCINCNIILDDKNWLLSHQKKHMYQCKDCHRKYRKELSENLRREVLLAYGNQCSCCLCSIIEFLTIDHINNDGAEHRRKIGGGGKSSYYWLKRNNYPKDNFQILCFNCNLAKRICGSCLCVQISKTA